MEDATIWAIYELSNHLYVHMSSLMKKIVDVGIYFLANHFKILVYYLLLLHIWSREYIIK